MLLFDAPVFHFLECQHPEPAVVDSGLALRFQLVARPRAALPVIAAMLALAQGARRRSLATGLAGPWHVPADPAV